MDEVTTMCKMNYSFPFFEMENKSFIVMTLGIIIKVWISLWASAVNQVNINLKNMLFASDKNTKM